MSKELLLQQEQLLAEQKALLRQQKIINARKSFIDFCELVIKDEKSGDPIKLAELHKTWIYHIGFCMKNNLNCLILAPMSAGKCVDPYTSIVTNEGALQARELCEGMKILAFDEQEKQTVWSTISAVEEFEKETMLIRTEHRSIIVSLDHPFWNGSEWVEAQDLRPNKDNICLSLGWEDTTYSSLDSVYEAYFFGVLLARSESQTFDLNFENVEMITKFAEEKNIEFSPSFYASSQNYRKEFYERVILGTYYKNDEIVISINDILISNQKIRDYFLSAVFDVLGEYDFKNKQLRFNTYTKDFADVLNLVLEASGFLFTSLRRSTSAAFSYYLIGDRFINDEFFHLPINPVRYMGRLKFVINGHPRNRILTSQVKSVQKLEKQKVIGIEVNKYSTFISNSLISHNTQIISVALPLYFIGKDPSNRIKLVCLSDDAAKERVTSIRGYIENDDDYHQVFPNVAPGDKTEWTKHKLVVGRDTFAKDATVDAKGIISSGIGGRCDLLIVDDIFDQRTAVSQPSTREQYLATYNQVWLSRVEPGGSVVAICTRWHEQDLAGMIMSDKTKLNRYGILIQAVSDDFSGIECKVIVPTRLHKEYIRNSKVPYVCVDF